MESEELKDLSFKTVDNEWHVKALELLKENARNRHNFGDVDGNLFEETDVSNLQEGEDF